jgi:hypothetical protein
MSKKPWEQYKSENHIDIDTVDEVLPTDKKPWEKFAEPVKKKESSVESQDGENGTKEPGSTDLPTPATKEVKPSEKPTEESPLQKSFDEWSTKRSSEYQKQYEDNLNKEIDKKRADVDADLRSKFKPGTKEWIDQVNKNEREIYEFSKKRSEELLNQVNISFKEESESESKRLTNQYNNKIKSEEDKSHQQLLKDTETGNFGIKKPVVEELAKKPLPSLIPDANKEKAAKQVVKSFQEEITGKREYDGLFDETTQKLSAIPPSFNKGVVSALTAIPKGVGILAQKLDQLTGEPPKSIEEYATYQLGDFLEKKAQEIGITAIDQMNAGFVNSTVPMAFGSMVGMILSGGPQSMGAKEVAIDAPKGILGNAAKTLSTPMAVSGALQASVPEFDAAKAAGQSDEEAFNVFLKNIPGGLTETVQIANMFGRLNRMTNNGLVNAIKLSGANGIEEAAQEGVQSWLTNIVAKGSYDPKRDLSEGLIEGAGAGFFVGFMMPGIMAAMDKMTPEDKAKTQEWLKETLKAPSTKPTTEVIQDNREAVKSTVDPGIATSAAQIVEEFKKDPEGAIAQATGQEVKLPETQVQQPSSDITTKSDEEIERRMIDLEGKTMFDSPEQSEYNTLEKEMEKREWNSVFSVPLPEAKSAIDNLIKKEKEMPNGYGAFIEKRDASESKQIIEKYSDKKSISDNDIKKDFKEALMGNPSTWYADGLKLRESANLASERGIEMSALLSEVENEFIKDGYDAQTAKEVIAGYLAKINPKASQSTRSLTTDETTVTDPEIKSPEGQVQEEEVVGQGTEAVDPQNEETPTPLTKEPTQLTLDSVKLTNEKYNGETAYDKFEREAPELRDDDAYTDYVATHSNNALELAEHYVMADSQTEEKDYKTQILDDHNIKVTEADFAHYGDPKNVSPLIGKRFFKNSATELDSQAADLSDQYGIEITPQDIVDHIMDFETKGASKKFKDKSKLQQRFAEITGGDNLTLDVARKIIKNQSYESTSDKSGEQKVSESTPKRSDSKQKQTQSKSGIAGLAERIRSKIGSLRSAKPEERQKIAQEIYEDTGKYLLNREGVIVGDDASFADRTSDTFFDLLDKNKSVYLLSPDAKIAETPEDYQKINDATRGKLQITDGKISFDDAFAVDAIKAAKELGYDAVRMQEIDGTNSTLQIINFDKLQHVAGKDFVKDRGNKNPPPPTKKKESEPPSDKSKTMAIADRVLKSDASEAIKRGVRERGATYIPKGLDITLSEAKNLIELYGDKADAIVRDLTNGISPDARVALTAKLYEKYVAEGNNEAAVDIAMWQAKQSLEAGRASNAAKIWKMITQSGEENIVLSIEKERMAAVEEVVQDDRPALQKSFSDIEAEIRRQVEERVQKEVEGRLDRAKLITKEKRKEIADFFDGLKADTSNKGMLSASVIPGLTLLPHVWNGAIEVMKQAVLTGADVANAVQAGLDYIKANQKEAIDEDKFKEFITPKIQPLIPKEKVKREKINDENISVPKKLTGRKKKEFIDSVVEAYNQGELTEKKLEEIYAGKLGVKEYTSEDRKRIRELAGIIDRAEKFEKELSENFTPENIKKYKEFVKDARRANSLLQEFAQRPNTIDNTLISIMQGNLLSPISLVSNIYYNINFQPLRFLSMGIGSIVDYSLSKLSKVGLVGESLGDRTIDFTALQKGYVKGGWNGLTEGVQQLKTGTEADENNLREIQSNFSPKRAIQRWSEPNRTSAQKANDYVEGTLGIPAEVMFRLLNMGDKPFRRAAEMARAMEMAKLKGLKGNDLLKFLIIPDQESAQEIKRAGDEATFQQNEGFGKKIQSYITDFLNTIASIPYIGKPAKVLLKSQIPFIKTPWNVAAETMMYAAPPITLAMGISQINKGNKRTGSVLIGKAIVGSMIQAVAYQLFIKGLLSGDDDKEKKKRDFQYDLYPNSLNTSAIARGLSGNGWDTKDGDIWVSYTKMGVTGILFDHYSNTYKERQINNEPLLDTDSYLTDLFVSGPKVASASLDQTFLQGTSAFLEAIKDGGDRKTQNWLIKTTEAVGSIVYPNTVATISKASDEYLRDVQDESFVKKLANTYKAKMFAGDSLPTRINIWGEKITGAPEGRNKYVYYLFDPTKFKEIDQDSYKVKLYDAFKKDFDAEWLPGAPSKSITVKGEKIKLNGPQYEALSTYIGQERADMTQAYINSSSWTRDTDEEKKQELKDIYRDGADIGRDLFMIDNGYNVSRVIPIRTEVSLRRIKRMQNRLTKSVKISN